MNDRQMSGRNSARARTRENNVVRRVSRASCVEWSDARESVFMVCGRHPRRVLKLRSRKTDAVRKLTSRKPFHPDTV